MVIWVESVRTALKPDSRVPISIGHIADFDMTQISVANETDRTEGILRELDGARRSGPLQHIAIPPCPELLSRLQQAMAPAEPDLNEVASIATCDVAMSATLIRCANSPIYAAGQPSQTIGQAMNRLGLEQTAAVMTAFLAKSSLKVPNSPYLQRFWERSAKRASAMAFIAERMPGMSIDVARTYGLFCHVGIPVMSQSVKGYLGTMVEAHARIDRTYVATENANHRTDHAVVGALVARLWRLAPPVIAGIRLHHDYEILAERQSESDVKNLIAMGLVAEFFMRRHESLDADIDWLRHGQAALAWLHLGTDELATWEDELTEVLDAV
jgi:HD-like signal output (HDOD) protein